MIWQPHRIDPGHNLLCLSLSPLNGVVWNAWGSLWLDSGYCSLAIAGDRRGRLVPLPAFASWLNRHAVNSARTDWLARWLICIM